MQQSFATIVLYRLPRTRNTRSISHCDQNNHINMKTLAAPLACGISHCETMMLTILIEKQFLMVEEYGWLRESTKTPVSTG